MVNLSQLHIINIHHMFTSSLWLLPCLQVWAVRSLVTQSLCSDALKCGISCVLEIIIIVRQIVQYCTSATDVPNIPVRRMMCESDKSVYLNSTFLTIFSLPKMYISLMKKGEKR